MFSKLIVAALMASSALAQSLLINTPAALIECQPVAITFTGANTPFIVAVIPGGQPSAAALEDFGTVTSPYTWTVNIASGTSITLKITDGQGNIAYSSPVTIQAGTSSACLTAAVSSAASTSASATASATAAASSAVTSVASIVSSVSSAASAAASSVSAAVSSVVASRAASSVAASSVAASSRASGSVSASAAASAAASATPSSSATKTVVGSFGALVLGFIGVAMI